MEQTQTIDQDEVVAATPASSSKELGRRGEEAATKFLKRRGFEVLERNWTCFAGEVDIVAHVDETLCFIEVKTRSNIQKGFPSEAVDGRKRERYERIAACYLKDHACEDMRVRFDVISILVLGDDRAFLRHHINAFGSM
jgi:putative endonuclease